MFRKLRSALFSAKSYKYIFVNCLISFHFISCSYIFMVTDDQVNEFHKYTSLNYIDLVTRYDQVSENIY
jgi:hypothetical protein